MPRLSVLIPARNAERTLGETLDSLVAQTWRDFDVVLVDDGSSDGTQQVIDRHGAGLALRVIRHEVNRGVAGSLNHGLSVIDAPYVARLDADDLAHPQRLERQLAWLEAHPEVDVLGSDLEIFLDGSDAPTQRLSHPTEAAGIRTALVQRCALAHPSLLIRRGFFDAVGGYDERADFAEDYDLWCRGALFGRHYANLAEPLTRYRRHDGQVSHQKSQLQLQRDLAIKRRYYAGLTGGEPVIHLPELLSLSTRFASRDIALQAWAASVPALIALEAVVPDRHEMARIVQGSLLRHLGG